MENMLQPAEPAVVAPSNGTDAAADSDAATQPTQARSRRLFFLRPSLTDVLFVALLAVLFFAGKYGLASLLADGDAGWHIRTGEHILDTRTVPTVDPYSFTRAGQPWYAWEWLSDVVFALAFRAMALKGVVLLAALLCVSACVLLFLQTLWRGGSMLVTLVLAQLATGAASIHFLARPHVFTLLLLVLSVWLIEIDRRSSTRWLWLLVPLTAVWTNLHGGFLSLIACAGLVAVGQAIETLLEPAPRRAGFRKAARYATVAAACLAASLVNPYGWQLHRHLLQYLRSDWIRSMIQEFQAPTFRTENQMQFEVLLLLGLVCCGLLLKKRRITEVLLILFWAHEALTSIRHATIFAIIAVPIASAELSGYWRAWSSRHGKRSLVGILAALERDMTPAFRFPGVWCAAIVAGLLLVNQPIPWPTDFPAVIFPVDSVARHREQLAASRVLTSDEWGDYLLFVNYPRQRVFADGRSDFYGPSIGNDYMALYMARFDWQRLLDKYRVESIFIPVDWPLATVLKTSAGWRLVDDDGRVIFFVRKSP